MENALGEMAGLRLALRAERRPKKRAASVSASTPDPDSESCDAAMSSSLVDSATAPRALGKGRTPPANA